MTKEEILDYIKKHINTKTYKEIGIDLGMSTDAIRGRARRASISKNNRTYGRTKQSYNKELESLNSSFILLEDFTRVGDLLLHKCNSCKHESKRKPQDILSTPKCSRCSVKKTNSIVPLEDMLIKLPAKYRYLSNYKGLATKCDILCTECSKVWQVAPGRLIRQDTGCPRCSAINTSKRCRTPIDEVYKKCADNGLQFLDEEYLGNKYDHTFKNLSCGHIFKYKLNYIKQNTCRVCSSELKQSLPEREVRQFIESLGFSTRRGRLPDGKEIDILIDGTNVGVEFNGDYWHSEATGKTSSYHLDKTNNFEGKLIHIYDFMWRSKKGLIKSMLAHSLKASPSTVYARKCSIKEVTSREARPFLDENHIQGFLAASKYLALYIDSKIVAMMTFNKSRFSSKYEYEIGRYSVLQNTSVVGGASRLFKYFLKTVNPKSVVSYCHRFYSDGGLYRSLGMTYAGVTRPGYWYLHPDRKTVSSRQKFQKHKLKDILPTFDPKKTEAENMTENNYSRIYDCGNYVFEWRS